MSEHCCSECNKTFAKANSLSKHKTRSHPEKPPEKFACFYCDYRTVYKFNLSKHVKKIHFNEDGTVVENKESSQPLKICSLCSTFGSSDRSQMIEHYVDSHDIPINQQILNFHSFDEFLNWKRETESQEYCRFVAGTSRRKRLTKHVWFYRCFRDGHYAPRGTGRRSLKVKGSVKIGSVCPCSMKVTKTLDTGTVSVLYITPHVGHKPDVSRLTLTKEEREYIASKISAGVPDDVLLTSLRDSMSFSVLSRLHLTTRKDLWNIKNSLLIQKKAEVDEHSKNGEANEGLIGSIHKNPEAGKRSTHAESMSAFTKDTQKKPVAEENTQFAELSLASLRNIKKETNLNERIKFEGMKQALIRRITTLIDSTKNCAQLEVINKAFLPLPVAINELESTPSACANFREIPESAAKRTVERCTRNINTSSSKTTPQNTVIDSHSVNYVLSEEAVSQTIYAADADDNRENGFQEFYHQ